MGHSISRRRFLRRAGLAAGLACASMGGPTIVRAADDRWGDLVGRFVYDGPPPERKKLTVDKDVDCCGKFDIRDESLVAGVDRGLANVFVYVRSKGIEISPALAEKTARRVVLDNRDCIFKPHCLTIWYDKQEFHSVNSDPVAQNIAFEPLGDTPCNAILPVGGNASYTFTRKQAVPVSIKCNYHPWESGYILPRDNPYAVVSAADGTFRLPQLPAGTWEFQAWHERLGYLDTPAWPKGRFEVTVKPGANDLGTIQLAAVLFEK